MQQWVSHFSGVHQSSWIMRRGCKLHVTKLALCSRSHPHACILNFNILSLCDFHYSSTTISEFSNFIIAYRLFVCAGRTTIFIIKIDVISAQIYFPAQFLTGTCLSLVYVCSTRQRYQTFLAPNWSLLFFCCFQHNILQRNLCFHTSSKSCERVELRSGGLASMEANM